MKKIIYVSAIYLLMLNCKKDDVATAVNNVITPPPPTKTTFDVDVKPLLATKCAGCHVAGGSRSTNYTDFTTTKNNIDAIIERVGRQPAATGFMPKNGTALTADQIAILNKWKTDGKLEK
ncbi:MAG: hypothetical protein KA313_07655 [Pseudarcicella sp.]|nr:hypothetical protein [Pseudarcicella sp.]